MALLTIILMIRTSFFWAVYFLQGDQMWLFYSKVLAIFGIKWRYFLAILKFFLSFYEILNYFWAVFDYFQHFWLFLTIFENVHLVTLTFV